MSENEGFFGKMSFLDHLDELRRRLIYIIAAVLIAFLICWAFSPQIYAFIASPLTQFLPEDDNKLAYTSLTDPFFLYMKAAFIAALFLASPFILLQIWFFIAPALYRREKRYVFPFVFFSSVFFVGGGAFGFYAVFPAACKFFLSVGENFKQVITIREYFSLFSRIILGVGLVFEMPVLTFFLARIGLVTASFLWKNTKYAILLIFIIAAAITPTPDIVTQAFVAVPMIGLYGISILVALLFGRKKDKEKEEEKLEEDRNL